MENAQTNPARPKRLVTIIVSGVITVIAAVAGAFATRTEIGSSIVGTIFQFDIHPGDHVQMAEEENARCSVPSETQLRILEMVERGILTPEQGQEYIEALRERCNQEVEAVVPA